MTWTFLCILLSGLLIILFRVFRQYRVSLLQTIVVNYWVCVAIGTALVPSYLEQALAMPWQAWLTAIVQGGLFIGLFFLIGYASQEVGLAYTAMLTKLSVIIPTFVSWLAFQDNMTWERWLGMAIALFAVWLLHLPYLRGPAAAGSSSKKLWLLSGVLLVGTGMADSNLKLFNHYYGASVKEEVFTISLFCTAAVIGTSLFLIQWARGATRPVFRNVFSGVLLGLPNYFSILTLLLALAHIDGTVFFPVNNIGQLVFVSLVGVFAFREQYPWRSWMGLLLAIGAILLIAWRNLFGG